MAKSTNQPQPIMTKNCQNLWQQALIAHQQNQLTLAIALYQKVIAQNPKFADAYANLAMALSSNSQHQEADRAFCRALALQPDHANNHSNYGFFLNCLKQQHKAEQHLRRAVQLAPQLGIAWFNLGNVLRSLDRWEEAVSCYQVSWPLDSTKLEILSDWVFGLKKICRWSAQEAVALTLLQASAYELERGKPSPINPFLACLLPLSLAEFQQICASHAQDVSRLVQQQGLQGRFDPSQRRSNSKIKVGYVCAAFSRHPTGHLIEGMFERHDRSRFEIYGYAVSANDGSSYRQHIQNAIEHFRDVHDLSSLAIAETIFQDGIDILVDLDGYTANHRQLVFALKPAPIQVTWLAFPGTTGATYIDYLIADPVVVPPKSDRFYSEAIVRLPHTYQVNNHRQLSPIPQLHRPTARKAQGLPETAIVFCSFNNNTKIDFPTYQAWLAILKAVPESVLWILVDTGEGLENLRRAALSAGVAPTRVIPASRIEEVLEHIQRIQLADLYLDCFIYNAHTTATDALWAGVPVLTCVGETFASRVGASLLKAAGLPELICESPTQFVDKAIHLAQNPQELQVFRKHLQQHKYHLPAFDTDVWVRDFEAAMVIMCDRFLSSQPIQAIEVPAERQEGQDNENKSFLKLFPTTEKIRKGKDPED
jgi:predicted O-linked N-acetylglucosamine transferase (SPINDLY family)